MQKLKVLQHSREMIIESWVFFQPLCAFCTREGSQIRENAGHSMLWPGKTQMVSLWDHCRVQDNLSFIKYLSALAHLRCFLTVMQTLEVWYCPPTACNRSTEVLGHQEPNTDVHGYQEGSASLGNEGPHTPRRLSVLVCCLLQCVYDLP